MYLSALSGPSHLKQNTLTSMSKFPPPVLMSPQCVFPPNVLNCDSETPRLLLLHIPLELVCIIHREESCLCLKHGRQRSTFRLSAYILYAHTHTLRTYTHARTHTLGGKPTTAHFASHSPVQPLQQGQLHKENIFGGLAYFKAL